MTDLLRKLKPSGRHLLVPAQFVSGGFPNLEEISEPFDRGVDLEPLKSLLAETMRRFSPAQKPQSDAWLAPRVHATLRLFRREAADTDLWEFLSLKCRDYVMWRWAGADGPPRERIYCPTRRHALARLWWLAELTRNGPDYSQTEAAFRLQETAQYLLDVRAFQNRPAALAFVRYLGSESDRIAVRRIARALDHVLTTIVLDSLVPDPGPDIDAQRAWVNEKPDETLMYNRLPEGPDEPFISDEEIERVIEVIRRTQVGKVAGISASSHVGRRPKGNRRGDSPEGASEEVAAADNTEV